jgi:hypothetical protein
LRCRQALAHINIPWILQQRLLKVVDRFIEPVLLSKHDAESVEILSVSGSKLNGFSKF